MGYIYGLLASIIWGSWMTLTRLGFKSSLTVDDITFIRLAVGAIIILPILIKKGFMPKGLFNTLAIALSGGLIFIVSFNIGLKHNEVVYGAITPVLVPFFVATLNYIFYKKTIKPKQLFGIFLSILGIIILLQNSYSVLNDKWYLFFILAALSWAIYTILLPLAKLDIFHLAALVIFWSAIIYIPYYIFVVDTKNIFNANINDILVQVIMQGVMVGIVALVFYNKATILLGSLRASIFPILMPIIGIITSAIILSETISLLQGIVISLMIFGVLLAIGVI